MNLRKIVIIYFQLGTFLVFTQENLLVNPNCDIYITCPTTTGQIALASGWWSYDSWATVDYINTCGVNPPITIPSYFGEQYPLSGNGYIHSVVLSSHFPANYMFWTGSEFIQSRESFGGTFTQPLKPVKHYIEFYVNFTKYGWSDGFGGGEGRVATNAFDLLLLDTNSPIYNSVPPYIDLNDVIKVHKGNAVINDTVSWIKLSTCFIPKGGEKYFAIGAFRDTNDISLEYSGATLTDQYVASYYFDNFNVYECPTCCPDLFSEEQQVYVTSNPSTSTHPAQITVWLYPNTEAILEVYDSAGRLVARHKYTELMNTFSFENYAEGMYHFTVQGNDGLKETGKVVVIDN